MIPAQRMHAKGVGAYGTFAVTDEVGRCVRVETASAIGKQTLVFACFPTASGGWGAADVVGQQRATDRTGVEGHPSRQVENCAKSGPTL
ncbi:catalase [Burkholderia lata]